jgi:hypothetical protein
MKKIAAFLFISICLTACAQQKLGKRVQSMSSLTDTIALSEMGWFYKSLVNTIKYHPVARENQNTGKLIALFAIDNKRKVKYVKILKTPVDLLSDNVVDALTKMSFPSTIKPGKAYIIPISFTLSYNRPSGSFQTPPPVSENSSVVYNPNKVKIPDPARALILNEITKIGYVIWGKEETVE